MVDAAIDRLKAAGPAKCREREQGGENEHGDLGENEKDPRRGAPQRGSGVRLGANQTATRSRRVLPGLKCTYDFSATNHYGITKNPYVLATIEAGKPKIVK